MVTWDRYFLEVPGVHQFPENILMDVTTIRPNWVTWVPRMASTLFLGFQKAFMAQGWAYSLGKSSRCSYPLLKPWRMRKVLLTLPHH